MGKEDREVLFLVRRGEGRLTKEKRRRDRAVQQVDPRNKLPRSQTPCPIWFWDGGGRLLDADAWPEMAGKDNLTVPSVSTPCIQK